MFAHILGTLLTLRRFNIENCSPVNNQPKHLIKIKVLHPMLMKQEVVPYLMNISASGQNVVLATDLQQS